MKRILVFKMILLMTSPVFASPSLRPADFFPSVHQVETDVPSQQEKSSSGVPLIRVLDTGLASQIVEFEHMREQMPEHIQEMIKRIEEAKIHIEYGDTYSKKGQYDLALAEYARALELDPECVECYHNRGLTYDTLKKYDLALADYARALRLMPDFESVLNARTSIYHRLRQVEASPGNIKTALHPDAEEALYLSNRGKLSLDMGDYDAAISFLSQSIELNPEFFEAYYHRGLTWEAKGDQVRAKKDYETMLRFLQTTGAAVAGIPEEYIKTVYSDTQQRVSALGH